MKENGSIVRRAALISLLVMSMLVVAVVLGIGSMVSMAYASEGEGHLLKLMPYYTETAGGRIYLGEVEHSYYLFLPNEADLEHITIKAEDQSETVVFDMDGGESEELDLGDLEKSGDAWSVDVVIRDKGGAAKESFDLKIMQGIGIGTMYYTSDDAVDHGREWIELSKENSGSGKAIVFNANGENLTEDAKNQVVEDFHGRGAASWWKAKKGYQIKFDKKISLVDGTAKEKKWVLGAQYADPVHISDVIAKRIGALTRTDYSPQATWVNFYYDGEYRGVYELSEKNEIKSGRINITDMEDEYEEQDPDYGEHLDLKTASNKYGKSFQYQDGLTGPEEPGGFLIEMNSEYWDENNGFIYNTGETVGAMNIKSPDLGSYEAVKYISEYWQEFCDALSAVDESGVHTGKNPNTGKYYYEYCDLDSLVDTYLIQCLTSNNDGFNRSMFFYKDRGGIMVAGPVWDMDRIFGTGVGHPSVPADADFMANRKIARDLLQIEEFRRRTARRYRDVYSKVMESLITTGELLPTYKSTYNEVKSGLAMDTLIWPKVFNEGDSDYFLNVRTPIASIVRWHMNWLERHKTFLDEYFHKMAVDTEDEHEYGPASPVTLSTHQRACLNHPDVVITEDCTFETVSNKDGTHTTKCTLCDNKKTENCSLKYNDNGDGTHTGTCGECGYKIVGSHTWDKGKVICKATTAKAGKIEYTCTLCGATKQEEIPKVKQADITINSATVTAASVKKVIEKVDAAGGAVNAVILGKKVKKISKGAFKKTGIKTVTLKTVSLKAKSVKGSLTGSTVSSIKVKVGGAKKNKKYVKQYKKIFTKKNVGRKVKVS